MKYSVYGFGNALVDHEIAVTEEDLQSLEVKKSLMVLVDEARQQKLLSGIKHKIKKRSCGGSAANTIITSQQLDAKSFYSYKVANDEAGDFFYQDLKGHLVDSNFDQTGRPEGTTGKCLVMITPDAERSMETFLGITATVSEKQLDYDALKNSKYFYIEGYLVASPTAMDAVLAAKKFCKENKIKTSLSFSDPGIVDFFRDGMNEIVGDGLDLIFANEKEALSFTSTTSVQEAVEKMKQHAKAFVITRGALGSLVYDGKSLHTVDGFKVDAIDTTGAGDVFAGAFLASIEKGFEYKVAAKIANYAASLVVAKYGARLDENEISNVKKLMAEPS
ncbi:MAG: adenosine kinase [Bdellovibrionales bacterium]|nr:adenosine kinase [Bdellovibrionales bacterium]